MFSLYSWEILRYITMGHIFEHPSIMIKKSYPSSVDKTNWWNSLKPALVIIFHVFETFVPGSWYSTYGVTMILSGRTQFPETNDPRYCFFIPFMFRNTNTLHEKSAQGVFTKRWNQGTYRSIGAISRSTLLSNENPRNYPS